MNTNHQGKLKASLGKITKVREFLQDVRTEVMKNYALGKTTSVRDIVMKHTMNTMMVTWTIEAGALKDCNAGGPKSAAKLYKWVYNEDSNGTIDQNIVDKVIECERRYFRLNAEKNKLAQGTEEAKPPKETMKKLPTGSSASVDSIILWINEELDKEDQVTGYLRNVQKKMYETIVDTISNLKPSLEALKAAIDNINL